MTGLGREMVRQYAKRREQAILAQEQRRDEAYARIPALADLEADIGTLGVRYARGILHDGPENATGLSTRLDELRQRRVDLLSQAGFPANWLDPQWQCPLCEDTGYAVADAGRTAMPCSCSRPLVLDRLYRISRLSRDPEIGFDRFSLAYYPDAVSRETFGVDGNVRDHMEAVFTRIRAFADTFPEPETRSLYLYGPTGTGKTFLAKCAGNALLEKGYSVLYLSAPALFEAMREAKYHDDDKPDVVDTYRRILDSDLLILDDLGTEPASDSRYADLLTLLDARAQTNTTPRRTLIATNMDLKRLYAVYNERIGSRIAGAYDILPFAGKDIRVLKRFG